MNITQLKNLLRYVSDGNPNIKLPDEFINEFQVKEFNTCWYNSAGLDTKILDLFTKNVINGGLLSDDVLNNTPIRVYFFTDESYDFHSLLDIKYYNKEYSFEEGIWSEFPPDENRVKTIRKGILLTEKFENLINQFCLVKFIIGDIDTYVFFIKSDNLEFENLLMEKRLKIEVVCNAGGMCGKTSINLNQLRVKFFLGYYDGTDPLIEIRNDIHWGLVGDIYTQICSLYKVIY